MAALKLNPQELKLAYQAVSRFLDAQAGVSDYLDAMSDLRYTLENELKRLGFRDSDLHRVDRSTTSWRGLK